MRGPQCSVEDGVLGVVALQFSELGLLSDSPQKVVERKRGHGPIRRLDDALASLHGASAELHFLGARGQSASGVHLRRQLRREAQDALRSEHCWEYVVRIHGELVHILKVEMRRIYLPHLAIQLACHELRLLVQIDHLSLVLNPIRKRWEGVHQGLHKRSSLRAASLSSRDGMLEHESTQRLVSLALENLAGLIEYIANLGGQIRQWATGLAAIDPWHDHRLGIDAQIEERSNRVEGEGGQVIGCDALGAEVHPEQPIHDGVGRTAI
mmetsp:Transcript_5869/g.18687  ORF Transcript_5869/g.18687 Transcript_5869/m.18687 type:complete len:267 (-) Transcript_5869:265-1065(-)